MTTPINPYVAGNPVGDSPAFIGRADVLREVLHVLRRPQDNAIVLYGQRRIGKTSILQHLEAWLPREGPYHPVYFDLQDKAASPLGHVLQELAHAIAQKLGRTDSDLGSDPETTFRQIWLPAILRDLSEDSLPRTPRAEDYPDIQHRRPKPERPSERAIPQDKRPPVRFDYRRATIPRRPSHSKGYSEWETRSQLVLLFDEFDVLSDNKDKLAAAAFFPYLRDLLASNRQQLKFVFAIGRNLDDDAITLSFFKGAQSRRVSLLNRDDTTSLVRLSEATNTLRWPDDAVERVWQWTCGHPFLTQELCSCVCERAYDTNPIEPPIVIPSDIDAAVASALDASKNAMNWLWGGLPPAEKIVVSALAEAGPRPITQEELESILLESGVRVVIRELRDAPRLLRDWDLIEPADSGYRFRVELLRRWVADYQPLHRVWQEMDKIEPAAERLYQIAFDLYRDGQLDRAVVSLRQAVEINPNHARANELLADILLAQGQVDEARRLLEQLYEYQPAAARPHLMRVLLAQAQTTQKSGEKLIFYKRLLALDPKQPEAKDRVAEIELALDTKLQALETLEQGNQYREALTLLDSLAGEYPEARDWVSERERLQRKPSLYNQYQEAAQRDDRIATESLLTQLIDLERSYQLPVPYLEKMDWDRVARLDAKQGIGTVIRGAKRVLAIGVGGSGKATLTILKERLEETYGYVPDNVVLLALDTDDLREVDTFVGTRLTSQFDDRRREPEFRHVVSKPGVTMDTIFADIASGWTAAYMSWLEKEKLDRTLGPAERDIRGGAQQRRPVGRVAVFQRWDNPIASSIMDAITRVYGEPEQEQEQPVDAIKVEQSKRLIFIVGSVAGGTGSGSLIDVANLVRHAIQSNSRWQSVDVSAIIVLPDAFSTYTTAMNDPTNLKPNSYAALRELDRFQRTHSASRPYMIRYGDDLRSITWSTNQLLDHVYLVDTASPSAMGDFDLRGDPIRGVFPVIADFIMSHVDPSLGDALATLRSNAGLHYDKEEGWQYSSFNVMTYIFPVDDVIESFSYRFLRELLARQFLPIGDKKISAAVEQGAVKEAERVFSDNSVLGKVNPGVIQKAIAATRRIDPETPDTSWTGLFNMIALSEGAFAQDYQDLEQWLGYLSSNLVPTKEGEYKQEKYDEGYVRLLNFSEQYMDDCLGAKYDPDNEDARQHGEWDKILGRYRDALRLRFSEAMDVALLDALNRRDPQSKMLSPARLLYARFMVTVLKDRLVRFKAVLEEEYRKSDIDTRIRQTSEQLRGAIAYMQDTKDTKTFALLGKPEARKAQDAYIGLFQERMELLLHQCIYRVVSDVLNALGADEKDSDGTPSVLEQTGLELENWQATYYEVDKFLDGWWRKHEANRKEKSQVKVRRYLTDPKFEDQLYGQQEHVGIVASHVLGQVKGEKGMTWQRIEETEPLRYKVVSAWMEEAKGADKIAREFFVGVKDLFQVVREHVTVADRVAATFTLPASFVNTVGQVNEPFLRYSQAINEKTMFHERYVSFNLDKATNEGRSFLEDARGTLRNQGVNLDTAAESTVACTVVEVARGVKLRAVDQFIACEPEYRAKLYRGRESLHLFPEEQVASDYEGRIETLGEPDNRQRPLAPDLVIAMGDEGKLRAFTLACAYGLIEPDTFLHRETGGETTELFLSIRRDGAERRLVLSQSQLVRQLEPRFASISLDDQMARLYLNALQNFVLKATQKSGVPLQMVDYLVQNLNARGVNLGFVHNPFTLDLRDVNEAIRWAADDLGPSNQEEPNVREREANNSKRRQARLEKFLSERVAQFKRSPSQRVRDMGIVMHMILHSEIYSVRAISSRTRE